MTAHIAQLTLDVHDAAAQADFWAAALDLSRDFREDGSVKLYPREDAPPGALMFWLQPVTEPKRDKLRLHLDLRPRDGDVEAEVERLIGLGATHADVGQGDDDPFVVLADPEGNEFCVLRRDPR